MIRHPERRLLALLFMLTLPFGALEVLLPWFMLSVGGSALHIGFMSGAAAATTLCVRPIAGHFVTHQALRQVIYAGILAVLVGLLIWSRADSWLTVVLGRVWSAGGISCVILAAQVIVARSLAAAGRRFGVLSSMLFFSAAVGSVLAAILLFFLDLETQTQVLQVLGTFGIQLTLSTAGSTLSAFHWLYFVYALLGVSSLFLARLPLSIAVDLAPIGVFQRWKSLGQQVTVRRLIAVQFLIRCAYSASIPLLIVFLNDRFETTLLVFGVAYAIPGLCYMLTPSIMGRVADRIGYSQAVFAGLMISMAVYAGIPWMPHIALVSLLWVGEAWGYGLYGPALLALISKTTRSSDHGALFSLNSVVADIGSLVAAPLGGLLYGFAVWLPFTLSALAFCGAGLILRGINYDNPNYPLSISSVE